MVWRRYTRETRDREARILDLTRVVLVSQGCHGLSMDHIAEALEYSKRTMYQHFSRREETVLTLAGVSLTDRLTLFRRIDGGA
ncbi:MAG: helix-turn-helix domain-containing protein [Pirellulales bacterium]